MMGCAMIIRVDSIDNMVDDLAAYFACKKHEFLSDLQNINFRNGYTPEIQDYLCQKRKESLEEIYLCHLTRRLHGDKSNQLLPLNFALTQDTTLASFFRAYDISFRRRDNGVLEVLHCKNPLQWWKCDTKGFNKKRLYQRLTNDYCVNGFRFLYDIENNNASYFRWYTGAPEIIRDINYVLSEDILGDFIKGSEAFAALCKVSKNDVIVDGCASAFENSYIYSAMSFVKEYYFASVSSVSNPIIFVRNNVCVDVETWVPISQIRSRAII